MIIRPAQLEDVQGMARVIVDTFLATNRGLMSEEAWNKRESEWTYDASARSWEQALTEIANGAAPRSCIYVAEESGEVVGVAMGCPSKDATEQENTEGQRAASDDEAGNDGAIGEVDILYVRQSHQRQGIGRSLVQAVVKELVEMGMSTIHICTPVAAAPARIFYERLGGRGAGIRDDYADGELVPLVVYEWTDPQVLTGTHNSWAALGS